MRVTLTVSTWDFKHLGGQASAPEGVIRQIGSLGFVPELWLNWDPQLDFFDRSNWEHVHEVVKPTAALSFHTRNDRERMIEEIELLALLGGRVLVVHPCVLSEPEYRGENPAMHPDVPFIRELASAAREHGVFLGLENIHARAFLDLTLEAVETFDQRGGLGICIDLGHAEMRRGHPNETPADLIRDYGSVLLHLHVHDVVMREAGPRDHVPLGTGVMDYGEIASALREVDFNGTAALEIQCDDPVAMIHQGVEYLRRDFGQELICPGQDGYPA